MKPTAFPYVRPNTAVVIKSGSIQGVSRDVSGDVVPYSELDTDTAKNAYADGLNVKTNIGYFCFSKTMFETLLSKGLLVFYS